MDGLAPAPPIGLSGWSRASARCGSSTLAGPARPARDVTIRVTASLRPRWETWPRDVMIVRLRFHLAPYPIIVHSSESVGVLGPLRGGVRACGPSGWPRALPDRVASRWCGFKPARRIGGKGLPSRLAWNARKLWRSCELESYISTDSTHWNGNSVDSRCVTKNP